MNSVTFSFLEGKESEDSIGRMKSGISGGDWRCPESLRKKREIQDIANKKETFISSDAE